MRIGPLSSRRTPARAGARRRPAPVVRLGVQQVPVRHQQQADDQAGGAGERQGDAPVEQRGQEHDHRRGEGEAGVAAKGVDREGAAHAPLLDRAREDRVVGGMEHAVAQARDHHQRDQHRIARKQADQTDRQAEQGEPGDQDRAGAEAIDEEPDRRLGQAGDAVQHGERQPERGVADAELVAQQRKQGRQDQDVEVTEEVRRADQADHLEIAPGAGDGALDDGHERELGRLPGWVEAGAPSRPAAPGPCDRAGWGARGPRPGAARPRPRSGPRSGSGSD